MEVVRRTVPDPIGLIRVAGLIPIVAHLGRAGAPLTRLLEGVGFSTRLLDHPEALIPSWQAARFIDEAASVPGFGNIALVAGLGGPLEALGTFGRLVRRAHTLEDALDIALRNMPAFDSGTRWWLERDGTLVRLCHALVDTSDGAHRRAGEYRSSLAMNLVRLAAVPSDDIRRLERVVTFPAFLLGRVLPPCPRQRSGADDDIEGWAASAPAADFRGSVQQVIETLSLVDQPRIPLVANAIGMSVRVLQRRLAQADATFAGLVAHGRLGAAAELLEDTDAAILDIALDLGYSDHAHFTRAFRRWTGVPPREFRRMSRQLAGRSAVRRDSPLLDRALSA